MIELWGRRWYLVLRVVEIFSTARGLHRSHNFRWWGFRHYFPLVLVLLTVAGGAFLPISLGDILPT
jgi:hypothetical protein